MGLNITVHDFSTGKNVPEWDFIRYHGDRDLAAAIEGGNFETRPRKDFDDDMIWYRPRFEGEWAALVTSVLWPSDRAQDLISILEKNPNAWVAFSR